MVHHTSVLDRSMDGCQLTTLAANASVAMIVTGDSLHMPLPACVRCCPRAALATCQIAAGEDLGARLKPLLAGPKCVAVGECGLDYNRMFSPMEDQHRVFEAQASARPRPVCHAPCSMCMCVLMCQCFATPGRSASLSNTLVATCGLAACR